MVPLATCGCSSPCLQEGQHCRPQRHVVHQSLEPSDQWKSEHGTNHFEIPACYEKFHIRLYSVWSKQVPIISVDIRIIVNTVVGDIFLLVMWPPHYLHDLFPLLLRLIAMDYWHRVVFNTHAVSKPLCLHVTIMTQIKTSKIACNSMFPVHTQSLAVSTRFLPSFSHAHYRTWQSQKEPGHIHS